jgi:hypothetical protein
MAKQYLRKKQLALRYGTTDRSVERMVKDGRIPEPDLYLALQLPFCFEVRALSDRLVSSTPERPCDDMCGLDSLSSESDGDAADFLN